MQTLAPGRDSGLSYRPPHAPDQLISLRRCRRLWGACGVGLTLEPPNARPVEPRTRRTEIHPANERAATERGDDRAATPRAEATRTHDLAASKCPVLVAARALQILREDRKPLPRKDHAMGYSIFYIIGVVVVVALILAWLF